MLFLAKNKALSQETSALKLKVYRGGEKRKKEEMSNNLEQELKILHNEYTTWNDLCKEMMDRIDENDNLQEQIKVVNRQLQIRKTLKD